MSLSTKAAMETSRNTTGSVFLFSLAVLGFLGALGLGFESLGFLKGQSEGGGFWFLAAMGLWLATLVCVALPSAMFLRRTGNSRFRISLRLSLITLLLIGLQYLALVVGG